jgi:putative nucleotidyltransferase with HDIG domain
VLDGDASLAATIRPVWSIAAALVGGIASAFLVLGLLPLFESVGFVTDFRLMELANLNHPLLRQLMLRAPGSYHHSVLVGTLAEAACEAIGANALQAKVSAYFHDIGKSIKPLYFIENQRGQVNRHLSLDPTRSAQVIISHVTDGGRMAREHNLPKPIIDNIYMHHGTGILQYFLDEARRRAPAGTIVDESLFRYPGPRPNNREAGAIMLADKVEAATRTIQHPNEANIRAMIHRIINSVMADGQFVDCPLTFKEISTIADTFVNVLLGIYHQRIEYASTADLSRGAGQHPPAEVVITLELPSSIAGMTPSPVPDSRELPEGDASSDMVDYESVEHLPHGG